MVCWPKNMVTMSRQCCRVPSYLVFFRKGLKSLFICLYECDYRVALHLTLVQYRYVSKLIKLLLRLANAVWDYRHWS